MTTAQQPSAPPEHSSTLHKLKPSHLVDSIKHTIRSHKDDKTRVADADDPYAISSGKAAERHARHRHERQERDERMERERQAIADKRAREDREAAQHEPPELRQRYGDLIYPQTLLELDEIASMAEAGDFEEHQEITFRARIHHHRNMGPALVFILFRRGIHTLQGVVHREATSEHMIDWTKRLPPESIVQVTGHVKAPREAVRQASISNIEICVEAIHLASQAHDLPFNVSNKPDALHTRLESRIVDLRDPANQAIFRIRARVMRVWRDCLDEQGFIEINTPKLQPAATESGAEVFKVRYFGRTAFLAQSPQLAKQMAISADLRKVYEIGPVFRAENSNTHRHLTEYTGLDLEMSIERDYHEAMWILVRALLKMFAALYAVQTEVDLVQEKWPSDRLALPDKAEDVPIIPFAQGIQMLRDDGRDTPFEDLSTRDEMRLGELVKDKYGYDFFVLDKFPKSARPFYTMPDTGKQDAPEETTNSFDMFVRGQEICTGGQRIHDPDQLRHEMKQSGIDEHSMQEYLEAFDWGVPPHAGAGLGLERILTFGMQLGNVRNASLFHRDPKSLPERKDALPHPESSTLLKHDKPPALEELIANYGDASNTAWLDDRFQIWRHERTGAAVGWVHKSGDKFVFSTGDPLCDPSQLAEVTTAFVEYAQKEIGAKPCWLLCSTEMQDILGKRFDFRTLSCAAEQRVDEEKRGNSDDIDSATGRTAKQGIECEEVQMTDDLRSKIDERIEQWKATRSSKGGQVHMTEIAPWRDMDHRRYFTATHDGQIDALVVLCRLAPRHGWQVKWALDFPNANSGSIEALIALALSSVGDQPVTFGAGVTEDLVPGHALGGVRAKFLDKTYKAIAKSLSLDGKASFREKFGIRREEVWVCFPKRSLITPGDAQEIVDFFKE